MNQRCPQMSLREKLASRYGTTNELAAVQYLVERWFPEAGRSAGRVDPLRLATDAGITVEHTTERSFEGCMRFSETGEAKLILSSLGCRARRRFTVAHELGHFALRKEMLDEGHGEAFRAVSNSRSEVAEEEEFANLIAAEVLMPRTALTQRVRKLGLSLRSVGSIAREFDVSRMALLRRLADLTGAAAVYLEVVPTLFRDFDTKAEVDDAVFVMPGSRPLKSRESTYLLGEPSFQSIINGNGTYSGSVHGPSGTFSAQFDCECRHLPIPHICMLAFEVSPISVTATCSFTGTRQN